MRHRTQQIGERTAYAAVIAILAVAALVLIAATFVYVLPGPECRNYRVDYRTGDFICLDSDAAP